MLILPQLAFGYLRRRCLARIASLGFRASQHSHLTVNASIIKCNLHEQAIPQRQKVRSLKCRNPNSCIPRPLNPKPNLVCESGQFSKLGSLFGSLFMWEPPSLGAEKGILQKGLGFGGLGF